MKTFYQSDLPVRFNAHFELQPKELHYLVKGAKGDKPSFAMVMGDLKGDLVVVGQFSLETLTDCLKELGYELKPFESIPDFPPTKQK